MLNSLRCCLACILPFGALDLIRIVHLNGYVDELPGRVTAGEFLKNYPNHSLTEPCSQGVSRRIRVLSPESSLKRGSIYFLVPSPSLPSKKSTKKYDDSSKQPLVAAEEKKSRKSRRHRKVTAEVWRPYLDSISEEL